MKLELTLKKINLLVAYHKRFDTNYQKIIQKVKTNSGIVKNIKMTLKYNFIPPFTYLKTSGGIVLNMLTYDIDINDCLWYIIYYFSSDNKLNNEDISNILIKCYIFLKYYNNNYRPIYHLENIMFYIINKINKYNELPKRMLIIRNRL